MLPFYSDQGSTQPSIWYSTDPTLKLVLNFQPLISLQMQ